MDGTEIVPKLHAANPHDLMRTHEVLDILTVAQLVLEASLARKASSVPLCFQRTDFPEEKTEERRHIVIRWEKGEAVIRDVPLDYFDPASASADEPGQICAGLPGY